MKIECTIRRDVTLRFENGSTERQVGTKVQFDGDDGAVEYHFKPGEAGEKHVAEVANEDHAAALLKITEAYAPADEDAAALADLVKPKVAADAPVADHSTLSTLTQEQLDAMGFKELKKLLTERFGKQLATTAKKEDYITALLNAQGL